MARASPTRRNIAQACSSSTRSSSARRRATTSPSDSHKRRIRCAAKHATSSTTFRRLGGFGIVAHPDSAKPGLRWRDWDAQFDAMEWLNADTEWRDERRPQSGARAAAVSVSTRRNAGVASRSSRRDARAMGRADAAPARSWRSPAPMHTHGPGWMDDDVERLPAGMVSEDSFLRRVVSHVRDARRARPSAARRRGVGCCANHRGPESGERCFQR